METKIKKKFEEMEMDKKAIFQKINSLDDEFLNRPPAPEKWSIIQILHHLIDAESGTLIYIKKKTLSPDKLEKAGLLEWWRSKVLNFYLKAPMKWKAPAMVDKVPIKETYQNTLDRYNKNREKWAEFLEEMPEDWAKKKIFRHPISGRLDMHMTLDFLDLHAQRHFQQIRQILKSQSNLS
jgi:uncharacterized damage-inducible protein DinB